MSEARDYFDTATASGRRLRFCRAGAGCQIPRDMVSLMRPLDGDGDQIEMHEREIGPVLQAIEGETYDGPWLIVMRPRDWSKARRMFQGRIIE